MIEFKNLTKPHKDTKILKRLYNKIFSARRNFELSVVFAPPPFMRRLNRIYRNKNKTADVLSFLLEKNKGEIFLNFKKSNLPRLFTHGALHLLGFNHKTEKGYKIMRRKELKTLNILNLK
ncbi:MAG: rRNA maturation RNAse YbeY [Candidatus Giovannonibacteria bacterium]|nr:MAG: rRNA maturation RNAse YbeY [Candidatus Giovannonibacteria bacterium]